MQSENEGRAAYSHLWDRLRAEDPEHSARYAQRWRDLAAEGRDLDGEARLVAALAAPGSAVLDAGCGQGRLGGYLSERGYRVAGVDLDEHLIAEARRAFPRAEWRVGDLAEFTYPSLDAAGAGSREARGFDAIVSAGNVLTFLDPAARRPALQGLRGALAPRGRLVTGFGAGRGYGFDEYAEDLAAAGLAVQHRFSTWDLRPFEADSDFLVCISAVVPPADDARP
ncbi:class I SAM-dependent methyltransferase [Leucobacter sp. CSA1]|uniref:Class I SAM-dependent methyltransferase n=1 Tax=Leucobacter chromiisoli TaxID=2796471 RepID=A0A934Q7K4_9MICO|nr:class I SAM-dependent methyltransferase [Leucobacter chromiisoli]MBK0418012.1 class I SAM-dependent methyltransferase [Leucobacter chromiisoli]